MSSSESMALLPAGVGEFVRRRLLEAAGLAVLGAAVALAVMLAGFNVGDPSLNHATEAEPTNPFGYAGAYAADLALHTFGLAPSVLVCGLVAWGWRLLDKNPVRSVWRHALALLASMLCFAIALAVLPAPPGWPLATGAGGALGDVLLDRLALTGSGIAPMLTRTGVAAIALALGAGLGLFGLALPWRDWLALGRQARLAVRRAASLFVGSRSTLARWGLLPRVGHRGRAAETRREPVFTEPAAPVRPEDLVAPRGLRPRSPRKADAPQQGIFDFASADDYRAPPLDLLRPAPSPADPSAESAYRDGLEQNARMLKSVLDDFGVRGEIVKVRPGPVVTLYELKPAPGTKSSRVIGLADDIARSMSAVAARVAVVPGRDAMGIELPNQNREMVSLREMLASETFERYPSTLTLALGKDIGGAPVFEDLARMPHLLIAGTTGSGKSVAINVMILSLLYRLSPEVCRLILIDPKMLELSVYEGIPHLLCPVVTEPGKAVVALKWTVREMEERYRAMSQLGVRNIAGFNARVHEAKRKGEKIVRRVQTGFDEQGRPEFGEQTFDLEPMPQIVVVVDEMADLMLVAGKDIEAAVQRLSQMARAAGIHLIMATQRPSVDVITGTIKANFPTRISFQVTSRIDSRTILGEQGAEQLLGQGDMLFMAAGGRVTRVHGPFVSDGEVEGVVQFLKSQGEPDYLAEVTESEDEPLPVAADEDDDGAGSGALYREAVEIVSRDGRASTSFIQRRLQIGYNRAARLMERMEAEGLVSKPDRVGRRQVLIGERAD